MSLRSNQSNRDNSWLLSDVDLGVWSWLLLNYYFIIIRNVHSSEGASVNIIVKFTVTPVNVVAKSRRDLPLEAALASVYITQYKERRKTMFC